MSVSTIIAAAGIPTAIVGFLVWLLERKMEKRFEEQKKAEEEREQAMILIIKSVNASVALGEAVAIGCKRSSELSGFNGEVEAAMKYAKDVKHEQKEFLQKKAVEHIYN